MRELTKTISAFITEAYGNRYIKDYKIAKKLPKSLRLKSLLHEPLKLFFKIKAAKVARNCSSQSDLSLAHRAEITFSPYDLSLFAGYLTNRPLNEEMGLFENSHWVHLLKYEPKKSKTVFSPFARSLSVLGPVHTNAFSKVSVSMSSKFYIYDRIDTNFMAPRLRMHF